MSIDRLALADCFSADEVLACLFKEMPALTPPIPIEVIAGEVGIAEIQRVDATNFEGALICNPEKSHGIIAVRSDSIPQRQRFSIGHELAHFLIPTHESSKQGFLCKEIAAYKNVNGDPQEREADSFSADLLMPYHLIRPDIVSIGEPDLEKILSLSKKYEMSMESFLRRYVSFCEFGCCAVFSKDNYVRYPVWSDGFPYLDTGKGLPIPRQSFAVHCNLGDGCVSETEEINPTYWLSEDGQKIPACLFEQTLCQSNGYKVTLIWFDEDLDDDEEEDIE